MNVSVSAFLGIILLVIISLIVQYLKTKRKEFFLRAIEYLKMHPKFNLTLHVVNGTGTVWLVFHWMPKDIILILGVIFIVITGIAITVRALSKYLKSNFIMGLLLGLGVGGFSLFWIPENLAFVLGAIFVVGGEIIHYVFTNLAAKEISS